MISAFRLTRLVLLAVVAFSASAQATVVNSLVISEVYYDAPGGDDGLEWVELFNGSGDTVVLDEWTLGFAGKSYLSGLLRLTGLLPPDEYFVVGGPTSNAANGTPRFHQHHDIEPDVQNGGVVADGVALFNLAPADIDVASLPFDAVIYGGENRSGLLDHLGSMTSVHVADAPAGRSISRLSGTDWHINLRPDPGTGALRSVTLPELPTVVLLLTGSLILAGVRVCGFAR